MNFYKMHIGDYTKRTQHLSILEHGVYFLMMHAYYGSEKPLPFGRDLYRILRASGKKDRSAIDSIVAQFWHQTPEGLVNKRGTEEIEKAVKLRELAQKNGNLGGRPMETQRVIEQKPNGLSKNNPVGSFQEPSGKAIQIPDSNSDSEDQGSSANSQVPPDPRKQLFDLGKTILGANAGGLISKAISASDEATVGAILGEMALRPTADPKAYFVAAARRKGESERFKTA